jgi:hypothetical protein
MAGAEMGPAPIPAASVPVPLAGIAAAGDGLPDPGDWWSF